MGDLVVKRTLVKSPPELWTEVSEVERLARHIGELGHIRISRLEPERAVAWEGDLASGTVEIEASGWGTRVILTAEVEEEALLRRTSRKREAPRAGGGAPSRRCSLPRSPRPSQSRRLPRSPRPRSSPRRAPKEGLSLTLLPRTRPFPTSPI